MPKLRPSEIVRFVMRLNGADVIYTNKRKNYRTVKCYLGQLSYFN